MKLCKLINNGSVYSYIGCLIAILIDNNIHAGTVYACNNLLTSIILMKILRSYFIYIKLATIKLLTYKISILNHLKYKTFKNKIEKI